MRREIKLARCASGEKISRDGCGKKSRNGESVGGEPLPLEDSGWLLGEFHMAIGKQYVSLMVAMQLLRPTQREIRRYTEQSVFGRFSVHLKIAITASIEFGLFNEASKPTK